MAFQSPAPPGSKTASRRDEWTSSELKGSAASRDSSRAFPCISGCRRQVQESQGGFPHPDNGPLCHDLRHHLRLFRSVVSCGRCCSFPTTIPPSLPSSSTHPVAACPLTFSPSPPNTSRFRPSPFHAYRLLPRSTFHHCAAASHL